MTSLTTMYSLPSNNPLDAGSNHTLNRLIRTPIMCTLRYGKTNTLELPKNVRTSQGMIDSAALPDLLLPGQLSH